MSAAGHTPITFEWIPDSEPCDYQDENGAWQVDYNAECCVASDAKGRVCDSLSGIMDADAAYRLEVEAEMLPKATACAESMAAHDNLIAAAPDLLAACKSVLDSVPFASYRGDGELEECEARLKAAILKAEGGVK